MQIQPAKADKPAMTLKEIVAFALEVPLARSTSSARRPP